MARSLWAAAFVVAAPLVLAAPGTPGTWERIDNPAPVVGLDGKTHTAQCSGYPGTDPSFRFWARKGSSKNLVVFFEGGGACWDNLTCTFPIAGLPPQVPQFFVPAIAPATNPASYDGIFRADQPANPVADWNMVYIPYCTGDIHSGSATKQYTSVGHPVLPVPPGTPITINHRGFDNFMVVLEWMRKNFDKPKNVLVTGSSAGGYGATVNSPWIGRAFSQAHLYVLADASQGVTTPAWDTSNPGRGSWNQQFAPWVFGSDAASVPGREFLRRAAEGQPHAKVAQFTTALDGVQIGFYGVMKQFYGPGGTCPNSAVDWYQQMSRQLIADGNEVGNYRYYVAGGDYHTLLRSPTFYSESSAGTTFAQWLDDMLASRGGTNGVGGQWFNAACPTCLIDLPCQ
jgi:hypothetical protein